MINILDIQLTISKEKAFNRIHIEENTETYKNAVSSYDELCHLIKNNMKVTAGYKVAEGLILDELCNYESSVICFVSSHDNISEMSNRMMSEGDYLNGYLLYELAMDAIFNASNELNNIIKKEAAKKGFILSKRFAPGDGILSLNKQKVLLEVLKKEVEIDAYLNEANVVVPENTLLYMFGLKKGFDDENCFSSCSLCESINCQYREML